MKGNVEAKPPMAKKKRRSLSRYAVHKSFTDIREVENETNDGTKGETGEEAGEEVGANGSSNSIFKTTSSSVLTPWIAFMDKKTHRVCYYNTITEEQSWEVPEKFIWSDQDNLTSTLRDPEGLGDDFVDTAYVLPSVTAAIERRDRKVFQKGRAPLCTDTGKLADELGDAIPLYFDFLRSLIILFVLLTAINAPLLVANASGATIVSLLETNPASNRMNAVLALYSIGNAPIPSKNNHSTMVLFGHTEIIESAGYTLVFILSFSFVFIALAWACIHTYLEHKLAQNAKYLVSARNYTVEVKGLPPTATDVEVMEHFSKVYNLQYMDFRNRPILMRKNHMFDPPKDEPFYPTSDVSNSGNGLFKGSWVADMSLAKPIGDKLRNIFSHENLLQKLRRERAFFKYKRKLYNESSRAEEEAEKALLQLQTDVAGDAAKRAKEAQREKRKRHLECRKYLNAMQRHWDNVCKHENSIYNCLSVTKEAKKKRSKILFQKPRRAVSSNHKYRTPDDIVRAFVTFNQPESYRRCIEDYKGVNGFNKIFQEKPLQFLGEHPLQVTAAPDPSDIIWENLEISEAVRWNNKMTTCCITLFLLFASFICVLVPYRVGHALDKETVTPWLCDDALLNTYTSWANATGSNSTVPPTLRHVEHSGAECPAPTRQLNLQYSGDSAWRSTAPCALKNASSCYFDFRGDRVDPHDYCPCIDVGSVERQCSLRPPVSVDGHAVRHYSHNQMLNCYCQALVDAALANKSPEEVQALAARNDGACWDFMKAFFMSRALILFSTSSLSVINLVLESCMKTVTKWEKHDTRTLQTANIMLKVFVTLFINTSFILWFVNANMLSGEEGDSGPSLGLASFLRGRYDRMTAEWYVNIGSALTYMMILDCFVPHFVPMLTAALKTVEGNLQRSSRSQNWKGHIQRDLNMSLEYPTFEIEIRLAYIMNTFAFTCLYFSTLPLLLPLAVLSFTVSMWVDRIMILRVYSKPPVYDSEIIFVALQQFPYIILLSVGWNLFMPLRDFFVLALELDPAATPTSAISQLALLESVFYLLLGLFLCSALFETFGLFLPFKLRKQVSSACMPTRVVRYFVGLLRGANRRGNDVPIPVSDAQNDLAFTETCIKRLTTSDARACKYNDASLREKYGQSWSSTTFVENGTRFGAVRWRKSGRSDLTEKTYKKGDFKRTFEWIAERHLVSYKIERSPAYKDAVFAMKLQDHNKTH